MSHSCPLPPWQSWCQRRVGKERVFHEKDRRIGMLAADSGIEFIGTLSHLLHGSIGHKVEDKHRSVHTGYDIGNLQVEQGIAAKSQIDALTIEPTFQNIGMHHAGTGSAASLQDAGTIEYHRLLTFRQVYCRRGNGG